ncbi:MAG TPA: hypothetical protein VHX39_30570 [Acetobacteraceae bacterium]|jgi:hypothetical protein|nr:hypothetical protein [Acetobacteraceae bacterium]
MTTEPVVVTVPLLDDTLDPPPPSRVRALKRHLVQSLRDLRNAKRPERLVQKTTPEPAGFTAAVLRAGCATCQGHCCKGGGDHAYIDERTMARVRRNNPELDARAIIGLFLARLAPVAYRGSCLFHGTAGCTLGRGLRAELCNAYYCNGLQEFLQRQTVPERVQIVATRNGIERRSPVLSRADP